MKIWNCTSDVINAIQSGLQLMASQSEMVVDNDKIYFIIKDKWDNDRIKYIYALEDFHLDKQYPELYIPELAGTHPIVEDAHFNPEFVGFDTKGMCITEIIKKFNREKTKYKNTL